MKDELITFETAKLAKKKGFDSSHIEYRNLASGNIVLNWTDKLECFETQKAANIARLPTQSLLQKWLREVHNIDVHAQPFIMKEGEHSYLPDESYSFFLFKDGIYISDMVDFIDFEEALEMGLQKALKLIKS